MLDQRQIENNWATFIGLMVGSKNPTMKSIMQMCDALKEDHMLDGRTYAGFFNAPAGVGQHHCYCGGLVEHLIEMYETYDRLRYMLPSVSKAEVNDDYVLMAIIAHDLHKAYRTYHYLEDHEKTGKNENRVFGYAEVSETKLLTQDQHSAMLLSVHDVKLPLIVLNSLYCSEGGYKKSPPRETSALAKLVYLLDEFSSNVLYRMENPRKGIDYI